MKCNDIEQLQARLVDRDNLIQALKQNAASCFSWADDLKVSWKSLVNRVMQKLGY